MHTKINKKGLEMLEFKRELLKNHSELVEKSLLSTLEILIEKNIIDLSTYTLIKNRDVSLEDFEEYLGTKDTFLKNKDELTIYFDSLKEKLLYYLGNKYNIGNLESQVNENKKITLVKTFAIDESFVLSYFDTKEEDIPKLMRRKGFVERFSIMRLEKISKNLMKELKLNEIKIGSSYVYYLSSGKSYNIDILVEINIEKLEDENQFNKVLEDVQFALRKTDEHFCKILNP